MSVSCICRGGVNCWYPLKFTPLNTAKEKTEKNHRQRFVLCLLLMLLLFLLGDRVCILVFE